MSCLPQLLPRAHGSWAYSQASGTLSLREGMLFEMISAQRIASWATLHKGCCVTFGRICDHIGGAPGIEWMGTRVLLRPPIVPRTAPHRERPGSMFAVLRGDPAIRALPHTRVARTAGFQLFLGSLGPSGCEMFPTGCAFHLQLPAPCTSRVAPSWAAAGHNDKSPSPKDFWSILALALPPC